MSRSPWPRRPGELRFQATAWRVKGELLRLQAGKHTQPGEALAAAQACFENARPVARQQGARSFELGAAVSLCQLWRSCEQEKHGLDMLRGIFNQCHEGLNTGDMRRARALLQESCEIGWHRRA